MHALRKMQLDGVARRPYRSCAQRVLNHRVGAMAIIGKGVPDHDKGGACAGHE